MTKKCLICNKEFYVKPCKGDISKFCSHKCYWESKRQGFYPQAGFQKGHGDLGNEESHKRQGLKITGKKHFAWKGEEVGIKALHRWVRRQKGKPKICKDCGITPDMRELEWANVDHEYRRNLIDYISLCRSCHRKHDIEKNNYNPMLNLKAGSII